MPYKDLREYLRVLEEHGYLRRIKAEVDKDWEISCITRLVFQKTSEKERYAPFFENVKGFDIPVVCGVVGMSYYIYATGLETTMDKILEKWVYALEHPINAKIAKDGPCKENILIGDDVNLLKFPVPIWTPGKDAGPFITSPYCVTKDPDTGIRNVGTYRMQVKGKRKTGVDFGPKQHIAVHHRKYEAKDKPTPMAVVIGAEPTIGMTSVTKVPYGVDEFAVSGGLRGSPVELVKCETIDLEVPATAEIVLEGEIPPKFREEEGPFGEHGGFMGYPKMHPVFNIKCITHRDNPIFQAFMSQMPPSESSIIECIGREATVFKSLKYDLGFPIKDVHFKPTSGASLFLVISFTPQFPRQGKQIIFAAWSTVDPTYGKIIVVVDDDIDIRDPHMVDWALSHRMQPHRDVFIIPETPATTDPSLAPPGCPEEVYLVGSKMGIDATEKWRYPELALPPEELMEKAKKRMKEYGLT